MNKVVDCFMFYNELDMLQFRLEHLNDVVDYFVIAEATLTHQGNSKELNFEKNKHLYEKYLDKIIYVIVDDMPTTSSTFKITNSEEFNWQRERHQRAELIRGLKNLKLKDTDIILLSCCDEIPNCELVNEIKKYGINIFTDENNKKYKPSFIKAEDYNDDISIFYMDTYWYNLNTKSEAVWVFSRVCTYKKLIEIGGFQKFFEYSPKIHYLKGGWHFTYFGDENFIIEKLQSFAHECFNKEEYKNSEIISERVKNKVDLFNRPLEKLNSVEITESMFLPFNYRKLLDKN